MTSPSAELMDLRMKAPKISGKTIDAIHTKKVKSISQFIWFVHFSHSLVLSDILSAVLSAVSYINDQLPTTINSGSTSSKYENESQGTSFPLSPLRIYNGQIYYNKMAEGQYQILFGNFYTELPNHMRDKNSCGRKGNYNNTTVGLLIYFWYYYVGICYLFTRL